MSHELGRLEIESNGRIYYMKKILIATVIGTILAFCAWAAQPNQSGEKKNPKPDQKPSPTVTFIDNEQTNQAANPTNEGSPSFYASLKRPEWWLVFVALVTLYVINRQANEMARATKEMKKSTEAIKEQTIAVRDSTALQKTIKRQWLKLENWRTKIQGTPSDEEIVLQISVNITNPTDMTLTLKLIEWYKRGENETLRVEHELIPGGVRPTDFSIIIPKGEISRFYRNEMVLNIFGQITFVDAFGNREKTRVGHTGVGGSKGFDFSLFEHWLSNDEEEDYEEN